LRLVKFGLVGATGVAVNLAVFSGVKLFLFGTIGRSDLTLLISSLSGDEVSILSNFALNHRWTFRDTKNPSPIAIKLTRFHLISITGVLINNAVLFGLYKEFGVRDTLAKLLGILIAFLWNFFANRRWTWGQAAC
jgi:dolichol-phosphate mannosyltransferase